MSALACNLCVRGVRREQGESAKRTFFRAEDEGKGEEREGLVRLEAGDEGGVKPKPSAQGWTGGGERGVLTREARAGESWCVLSLSSSEERQEEEPGEEGAKRRVVHDTSRRECCECRRPLSCA